MEYEMFEEKVKETKDHNNNESKQWSRKMKKHNNKCR